MESHKNSCSKAPTSGGFQNPTTLLEARQETLIFMGSALKGNMALAVAPSIGNEPHLPIFYPFVMVKNKGFLPFPTCFPEFNISSNFFARFFPFFPDPPPLFPRFPRVFPPFPQPLPGPETLRPQRRSAAPPRPSESHRRWAASRARSRPGWPGGTWGRMGFPVKSQ